MEDEQAIEKQTIDRLMAMEKRELVEFAIQVCVSSEQSKIDFQKQIERNAMIRCVKMIAAHADEYFDKWALIAESEGGDIGAVKVSAFDIRHAATPICKELGMTIPECLKQNN